MYACMYVNMRVLFIMFLCICNYVCVSMYVPMFACKCVRTYVRTCIYIRSRVQKFPA